MKKVFYVFLVIVFLIFLKLIEYHFICKEKVIKIKPVWESKIDGLLELKNNLLLVHKNEYFADEKENQLIYLVNKNNGIILDSILDSAELIKSPIGIWKNISAKKNNRFFLSNFEESKNYLIDYKDYKVYLYYKKSYMRCNSTYFSIQFYKNGELKKEVFIDYVADLVCDKESVYILRYTAIKNNRIVKYNFEDMLKI